MRQFSNIPYAINIAAKTTINELLHKHNLVIEDLFWYATLFEVRYKSIYNLILMEKSTQVLELASGFSLRVLTMACQHRIHYIETDLADLEFEKEALVNDICNQASIIRPANYQKETLYAVNNDEFLQISALLNKDKPITIISEGLLQYLSKKELIAVLYNIRDLLSKHGGCWITPDFSLKDSVVNVSKKQQSFRQIISQYTNRELYSHAFTNQAEMDKFFAEAGLIAKQFSQIELAGPLESLTHISATPDLVQKLAPQMKLWRLEII